MSRAFLKFVRLRRNFFCDKIFQTLLEGTLLKKAAAFILIICMALLCAAPQSALADSSGLCYIALNEAFADGALAYFSGSTVYVPINCFADFRLYTSYHAADDTATLFNSSKQIFFELDTGQTYDGNDNYYNTSAIRRNGEVYVPLAFVCSQFGFSYSIIEGIGYGDVCRIKDSSYILADSQFLTAAESLMRSLYEQYSGGGTGTPGNEDPVEVGDADNPVYLSFQGLPSDTLIDALLQYGMPAGFFLTAEDIRTSPETVRRLVAEGFSVGALLGGEPLAEYEEFSSLLFEAARVKTLLVSAASAEYEEDVGGMAATAGLVYWDYDVDGVQGGAGISYASMVTAYIEFRPERADVRIQCGERTDSCIASVLLFLQENSYTVRAPNEVEAK